LIVATAPIEINRAPPRTIPVRAAEEAARAQNYPLARWYLRPLAGWLAARLAATRVRPWHVTLCGFTFATAAAALLLWQPSLAPCSALLLLAWWFCDRTDGLLARLQNTASPVGAWLDGNLDELVDLGLHLAMAHTAASQGAPWAWPLLIAFVFGKYLLMHSLANSRRPLTEVAQSSLPQARIRTLYHLPGNADIRTHLMILALASGYITAELALIAAYYNVRWIARYPLVIARAGRQPS
jgi:hypothetical protein